MFKLFPLDFKEFPYVDVKIWEWCPASCTDCRFNIDYIPSAKQFSLDNILERIDLVDKKFDKRFNLVFWNQDGLNHKDIIKILKAWLSTWREVRFQIDFDIKKKHLELLERIWEELWTNKIDIKIAQNCRWMTNTIEKVLVLLKLLSKTNSFLVYLDLFLDINKDKKIFDFFYSKFWKEDSDNKYCFYLWSKINIKLHDYSWKINHKNKWFDWLKRPACQQIDQLKVDSNYIYLKDSLDVYDNWDLFIHDNLCNIGDIRISNINFSDKEIHNNFNEYLIHLNKLKEKNTNQSDMCYECITNGFKYKNILN